MKVKRIKIFPIQEVDEAILKGVRALGYHQPTDDQKDAIRSFLGGEDVLFSLPKGVENPFALLVSLSCSTFLERVLVRSL